MTICTCRRSPRSGSRNAWMRIKNVNVASRLSNFSIFFGAIQMISCRSRLVMMDETWLYHYDPETKEQSIEWWHSGSPRLAPKYSECNIPLGKFSPQFFGIKKTSTSLVIFQRAKLPTRSVTLLCWCKWRTFWRKNTEGSSPSWSCSCTTMPCLTRHLQPTRNWLTWASSVLITHPILQILPRRKKIERSPFFVWPIDRLLPRRLDFIDNYFFLVAFAR
jgi:hypothetical protein